MEAKKKMCFVIGPIGAPDSEHRRHADMFLNIVVRPTIEDKYNVARPDEVLSPGSISDRMINDIHEAELAIADFTFHNPNAFYELGLRHSFGKPVIHFVNPPWTIPFDNADYRAIRQDIFTWPGVKKARSELTSYV